MVSSALLEPGRMLRSKGSGRASTLGATAGHNAQAVMASATPAVRSATRPRPPLEGKPIAVRPRDTRGHRLSLASRFYRRPPDASASVEPSAHGGDPASDHSSSFLSVASGFRSSWLASAGDASFHGSTTPLPAGAHLLRLAAPEQLVAAGAQRIAVHVSPEMVASRALIAQPGVKPRSPSPVDGELRQEHLDRSPESTHRAQLEQGLVFRPASEAPTTTTRLFVFSLYPARDRPASLPGVRWPCSPNEQLEHARTAYACRSWPAREGSSRSPAVVPLEDASGGSGDLGEVCRPSCPIGPPLWDSPRLLRPCPSLC